MTEQEYRVHFQRIQNKKIKLLVLNTKDVVVDEIEGYAIDGNVNVDANSSIRRTCNIKMVLNSKLFPSISSPIWLNKRFKLLIGIKDILTDEYIFFNWGIYSISNPTVDIQISENTINIRGYDKSCFLDGTISGYLENVVRIPVEVPIHKAIRETAITNGGETKLLIDTHEYTTPYEIEKQPNDTVWGLLDELTKLYMNYELYYDVNGYLRFNKVKNMLNDSVIFNFENDDLINAKQLDIDFNNIKNHIVVYGRLREDGLQVKAEKSITDEYNPLSPFTIEKIGKRNLVIIEDKYFTDEQCQIRAEYEEWKHTNFNEKITITCVPILFLDVNKLIEVNSSKYNISGKYIIENLSLGLKYDSIMTITAWKIY